MVDRIYYDYARKQGIVRLAELQTHFDLNYKEAKKIIDGMLADGCLTYESGLDYKFVKQEPEEPELIHRYRHPHRPSYTSAFEHIEGRKDDVDDFFTRLRRDLELENDDDDDDDDNSLFDDDSPLFDDDSSLFDNKPNALSTDLEEIDECLRRRIAELEAEARLPLLRQLHAAAKTLIEKKSRPVSTDRVPYLSLWTNENDLKCAINKRLESLIKSDKNLSLTKAIERAEICLNAVQDTCDRKMAQLYEYLVYTLKTTSNYKFNQLKKRLREESGQ